MAFGKKWDPEGVYVRRYVPELEKFGKEYIYEPWKAPVADQRAWGCLIKGDGTRGEPSQGDMRTYPKPIFDFSAQKEICMQGMKKAYSVGLYGDDKRVLNGSWRALFPDNAEGPTEGEDGLPGAQVPGCNSTNDGDQDEDEGRSKQHDLRQEEMASKVVGPKRTAEGRFKRAVTGKRNASQNQGTLDGFVKRKRALT